MLAILIQGSFHAFLEYRDATDVRRLVDAVGNVSERLLAAEARMRACLCSGL